MGDKEKGERIKKRKGEWEETKKKIYAYVIKAKLANTCSLKGIKQFRRRAGTGRPSSLPPAGPSPVIYIKV